MYKDAHSLNFNSAQWNTKYIYTHVTLSTHSEIGNISSTSESASSQEITPLQR